LIPVNVPVHPAPLYEAAGAFFIAAVLWTLQRRVNAISLFGAYLALSGVTRLLVELVRTNEPLVLGLSEPQLLGTASIIAGTVMLVVARRRARRTEAAIRSAVALGFRTPERLQL
jgi:phosphatidylglycerol:prolipoprotein diacylglycerol transferase